MTDNSGQAGTDIIVYGHDGRGLGHMSKSIAVALAVRRLAPQLSVLLVTGAKSAQALIGDAPLDWIKLPSYEVVEQNGESHEVTGPSNIPADALTSLRKRLLAEIITLLRPRCVLVDYYATGKRDELELALEASTQYGTAWVLGMRAIVGADKGVWSAAAVRAFKNHYKKLLIYSDPRTLHAETIEILNRHLSTEAQPVGYVSRALELEKHGALRASATAMPAGIAVFSWLSDASLDLMEALLDSLRGIGDALGQWQIVVGAGYAGPRKERLVAELRGLGFCRIAPVGPDYLVALKQAKVAIVYAGYNTLTDLLWAGTPSILVARKAEDDEQIENARWFQQQMGDQIAIVEEATVTAAELTQAIRQQSQRDHATNSLMSYNGSEQAALSLLEIINPRAG